jgi:hypothetical protein
MHPLDGAVMVGKKAALEKEDSEPYHGWLPQKVVWSFVTLYPRSADDVETEK